MARLDALLRQLKQEGGSDLHLAAGLAPRMRRRGHVEEMAGQAALDDPGLRAMLAELASEEQWREFEAAREKKLASVKATIVPVITQKTIVETDFVDVTLPDAATMATFDTLETDLTMDCENHRSGDCGAWDYISKPVDSTHLLTVLRGWLCP